MADEQPVVDQNGSGQSTQPPTTTPPSQSQDGQRNDNTETKIQGDLPERFKGKSASEIAQSYVELEKKLGDQSQEVGDMRKEIEGWKALGRVLEENPTLSDLVEKEIDRIAGKKGDSTSKSDQPPKADDVRLATENVIITKFEERFAIDRVDPEKKQKLHQAIGNELAEMVDPGGKMTVKQVMDSIPLDRLDRYLEKAYKLATINDREEQARIAGIVEARNNSEASFGSIPSSGVRSQQVKLTPEEQKVARRMGISEEDYIKEKLALDKQ